jgi:hypothetical protein
MAFLTVFSETGFPHVACLFERRGPLSTSPTAVDLKWRGFTPTSVSRFLWGLGVAGRIDKSDRQHLINNYARFEVEDSYLDDAERMINTSYKGATYVFGVCDCVSMAADVARKCRLIASSINSTPYGLVYSLSTFNNYTHWNVKPYPWTVVEQMTGGADGPKYG